MRMLAGKQNGATRTRAAGFTLVETIVGLALASVMISALYSCFGFGFSAVRATREDLQATQILLTRMERLRLCTWSQVTNPLLNPLSSTDYLDSRNKRTPCTVRFSAAVPPVGSLPEAYRTQMLLVTVTVSWASGNMQHDRSMQTYVANGGLYQFVSTGASL